MAGRPRTVRVHYRRAKLEGGELTFTLEQRLRRALAGALGTDAQERVLPISQDAQHKGCLHYSEAGPEALVFDVLHLDGRDSLPTWVKPKAPSPLAEIRVRPLGEEESSIGESAYVLVRGNNLAVIERLGLRTASLQRYLNSLLQKSGELESATEWRLVPKIEIDNPKMLTGGAKRIVVKPRAAVAGENPSGRADADGPSRFVTRQVDELLTHGARVLELIRAAGADEARIDRLREQMSNDLILRAKLEISVSKRSRKAKAEIDPDLVAQAFGDMTAENDVTIYAADGRTNGKLVQLVETVEVVETGGMIDWKRVNYALAAAMNAWAAKGAIELEP
jgi:hypothetical protein